jgi:hypothetical protein
MARTRTIRLTSRDWTGDGVITIAGGVLLAVAVLLPWANDGVPGRRVSYALTKPEEISGAMGTPWGLPLLGVAALVVALGAAMIWLGPHRLALLSGVVVTMSGIAACVLALDAAREALGWGYAAGAGLMLALLVGILLVPIGVASAMVGFLLRRQPAGPPAPPAS